MADGREWEPENCSDALTVVVEGAMRCDAVYIVYNLPVLYGDEFTLMAARIAWSSGTRTGHGGYALMLLVLQMTDAQMLERLMTRILVVPIQRPRLLVCWFTPTSDLTRYPSDPTPRQHPK